MKRFTNKPTREDLERLGVPPAGDRKLDRDADPNCDKCHGTGQVETPDRIRGCHVCPCTLEKRERKP